MAGHPIPPNSLRRYRPFLGLLLAAGILLALWIATRSPDESSSAPPTGSPKTTSGSTGSTTQPTTPPPDADASASPTKSTPAESTPPSPAVLQILKEFEAELRSGRLDRATILRRLAELREVVAAAEPQSAAMALLAVLQSGVDVRTGLGFVVGPGGVLTESPTYRLALMDLLAQTDPGTALDYSRTVLQRADNANEYAVALRTLGWLNTDGIHNAEISRAFTAMLDRTDWLQNPGPGFLEAFDTAVAVGGPVMAGELASVLRIEGLSADHPVNRAAFIALDRLMIREPGTVIGLARQDPEWLAWAPVQRASLYSRLDVRDPNQQAFLREILANGTLAPSELSYFASVFPNVNGFSGHRMVSGWELPESAERIDRATLDVVQQWTRDPALVRARPALLQVQSRLQGFLNR